MEEAECDASAKRTAFESLSRKDRIYWQTKAVQRLIEEGVPNFGPNAVNSMAQGLYRESTRTAEDLRREFMAGQRAAMRQERLPEDARKAASRLPKEGKK